LEQATRILKKRKIALDGFLEKEKGYLFRPSYTSGWSINFKVKQQFESELLKPKPAKT